MFCVSCTLLNPANLLCRSGHLVVCRLRLQMLTTALHLEALLQTLNHVEELVEEFRGPLLLRLGLIQGCRPCVALRHDRGRAPGVQTTFLFALVFGTLGLRLYPHTSTDSKACSTFYPQRRGCPLPALRAPKLPARG